ncbi:polyketide synthase HetM-like [Homalodisca vitripennis]|uniref:polyketide synthase HetM-like n=1 Tax=Homalodisca vitripennis TaxID=197043 RepID=UPI001EEB4902|nr:polyketide synthase HetM-like [Homalodisca vitripennis]
MQAREQFGLRKVVATERVIPLKGDVSLTLLGLTKDVYNSLCLDVDVVIHAAAQVNLILPFNALYNTNVLGTRNVLLFSAKSKIKPVHYISTNAVFPSGLRDVKENVDMNQFCNQLESGYSQTKWLAEQQVLAAIEKGLPVAIYRCGNVGGSRLVGGWNPADFNLYMLSGVLKTGFAPDIKWQIELTPVDFVSQVITQLVCNLHESVGKIFHLVNNNTLPCQNLYELFRHLGYNVKTIKYNEWKALILKEGEKDTQLFQLSQLLENLVKEEIYFSSDSTYSQENLTDVLKKMNISYPQVSSELFIWYIESLSSVGILPQAETDRNIVKPYGNLKGKVIVVTGASSGIGEGISRTLARAGARVVLAARRLDRLQAIVDSLRKSGAEATPVQLDVCNAEQVSTCMQEIESRVGPIDVLVNNAGVMFYQFMKKCDLARWQHMVNVNINGTLNCLAAVLGGMVARGSGHIVNITSDGARKPFPGLAVYCGTKYFVHCLSGALRSELASLGVKVTDVQPGDVSSELHNHVSDPEAELQFDWSTKVPILKPSDVGEAVLYALSQPSYCAVNEILLEPEQLPL